MKNSQDAKSRLGNLLLKEKIYVMIFSEAISEAKGSFYV